ncbi:MAG: MFS transporter [Chloroflexi bacterium]|nr:MFS transporter [Chloroflexota bacterium]
MDKNTHSRAAVRPILEPQAESQVQRRLSLLSTTFASLEYRDYVYLWLGQITHSGALWIDMIARSLLVLQLTGSPVHLGLVMATRTLPAVIFGVFAGVVADSFDRRTIPLTTKVTVFGLSAVFAALILGGWIDLWHVYVFTFLRGFTMAFDQPARRAMIPSIVPAELVTNAMALSAGSIQVMRILGAGLAGVIIAFGGLEMAFLTIVFCYAGAAVFTWLLKVPGHARPDYRGVRGMGSDLKEGVRFAWRVPAIRGVFLVALGYFTFGMTFVSIFAPLFAVKVLDIGESGFGYMMAVTGLGGVAGALLLAAISPGRRGLLLTGVLAGLGVLLIGFSAVSYLDSVVLVFVAAGLVGLGTSVFFPIANAVLVQEAPEDMRGRVLGLLSLDRGMTTLGGAAAGFLVVAMGVQTTLIVFGVCCILSALVTLAVVPSIRRID